jgi:tRNA-dihydrouridine synthase A
MSYALSKENLSVQLLDRRLSVAPMMDWTDRHCRFLHRLISPHALLYTEMIHTNALIHGDRARHLYYRTEEKPVALQLGGSDPDSLAKSALWGQEAGYAEINLNCGCPSDRVQQGQFGACLMAEPIRVAQAVKAMRMATSIPITVKTRLGIDEQDSYDFLQRFIETVHDQGGCNVFILHARKAWLKGLSPKENRDIPPLDWDRVHRIKQDYPHLTIITNGGFQTIAALEAQFPHVDGVMIGRKAYHDPYFLSLCEQSLYPNKSEMLRTRWQVAQAWLDYMKDEQTKGTPLKNITRHALGLFYAQACSKRWKHCLMKASKTNDLAELEENIALQFEITDTIID